jgi:hypothetical protein
MAFDASQSDASIGDRIGLRSTHNDRGKWHCALSLCHLGGSPIPNFCMGHNFVADSSSELIEVDMLAPTMLMPFVIPR